MQRICMFPLTNGRMTWNIGLESRAIVTIRGRQCFRS